MEESFGKEKAEQMQTKSIVIASVIIGVLIALANWANRSTSQQVYENPVAPHAAAIAGGYVEKGMTPDDVLKAIGEPDNKEVQQTSFGTIMYWSWTNHAKDCYNHWLSITFMDGKVSMFVLDENDRQQERRFRDKVDRLAFEMSKKGVKLVFGMTRDQVRDAVGAPDNVDVTDSKHGSEVWNYYGAKGAKTRHLHFECGVLADDWWSFQRGD